MPFPEERQAEVGGAQQIVTQPEFQEPGEVRSVIELLENREVVVHLLEAGAPEPATDGAVVLIGHESDKAEQLGGKYSVVKAQYRFGDTTGSLGVIGPKRMDYGYVVPLVEYLAGLFELETVDAALLIGSNVRMEQPLAGHRIRKAALAGGKVMFINPRDFDFRFSLAAKVIADPAGMVSALAAVAKAVGEAKDATPPENLKSLIADVEVNDDVKAMAKTLGDSQTATVLLGNLAVAHPAFAQLRALAVFIAQTTGAALGYLPESADSVGAWLSGCVPHRGPGGKASEQTGLHAQAMLAEPRKAYILLGLEPELDCWDGVTALEAMNQADLVVALTAFASDTLKNYADVVLPTATFAETSGTYVNAEGRWQSFQGATKPLGEARPAWKVLRVLGNSFGLDGFDYLDSQQVLVEAEQACESLQPDTLSVFDGEFADFTADGPLRVGDVPIYATDPLVRRAEALQQTPLALPAQIRVSHALAQKLGLHNAAEAKLKQANGDVILPLVLDDTVPDNCVWVPGALTASAALGPLVGPVQIGAA